MKPKSISIVIPTHNRVRMLERLLTSVKNQKNPPDEVVIVNDGSTDHTQKSLEDWQKQKQNFTPIVLYLPISQGPGAARNCGIQLASSDAVAFTDDDCMLHPAWINSIINSKQWSKPKVVGIGGKVLNYRKGTLSEYYSFHRILEPPKYIQYLVTANACYLKDHLLDVGGFDENHRYPGGEDNGLSFKLANRGYRFGFEKRMIVIHDYRTSIPAFLKTFFRYGKGCAQITHLYLNNQKFPTVRGKNDLF